MALKPGRYRVTFFEGCYIREAELYSPDGRTVEVIYTRTVRSWNGTKDDWRSGTLVPDALSEDEIDVVSDFVSHAFEHANKVKPWIVLIDQH